MIMLIPFVGGLFFTITTSYFYSATFTQSLIILMLSVLVADACFALVYAHSF